MAGSISNFLELELLDHVLGDGLADYTPEAALYVALATGSFGDDNSGTANEPTIGVAGYARVLHGGTGQPTAWNVAAARATTNNGIITFPQASGSWGTITHWGIYDASTAGNLIAHGDLSSSKVINSGDTASIADTAISIQATTGGMSNYLANELLDHITGRGAYASPLNVHCALVITTPITDSMTGTTITEPAVGGYARKAINAAFDAASAGATANTAAITFTQASGAAWGTIIDFCLVDAATVGNLLFYGSLDTATAIDDGDTAEFAAGAWDITMD